MKLKIRAAVVFGTIVCALPLWISTSATAAAADGGCRLYVGTETATFDSATTSTGSITGSAVISGGTAFTLTASDASGRYSGVLRVQVRGGGVLVTSDRGVLRSDGTFAEVGKVDGAASSGVFAGAAGGILLVGAQGASGAFTSRVDAVLCLP